ncbi:MAG: citrate lyase subunit alpha, partial [Fusobacteriaceae bacterium]|nr:citrate lyase subunit alpha [Fusobacteriaceae bacterium]
METEKQVTTKSNIKLPPRIEGYGEVKPFAGAFAAKPQGKKYAPGKGSCPPGTVKVLGSIAEAVEKTGLKDGMTISFHHHLRDGDYVLNCVMDEIARLGIKNLTICASSLTNAHEPLLEHIKSGVVTELQTSGLRGGIARAVSRQGILKKPVIFRTHGGRARAIEAGEVKIDVAFVAAPVSD